MNVTLDPTQFVNGKLVVHYSLRRRATFTLIQESFPGASQIGNINLVSVLVEQLDTSGQPITKNISTPIIAIGDSRVQVTSSDATLRGKQLTPDNMNQCVVNLVET